MLKESKRETLGGTQTKDHETIDCAPEEIDEVMGVHQFVGDNIDPGISLLRFLSKENISN